VVAAAATVNVDEPESPTGLAVAVTVYEPCVTLLTANEPVNAPFEIEQAEPVTTLPESEQLESLGAKPDPET
jgi:hypothetical protein